MIGGKLCTGSGTKEDPYVPIESTKVSTRAHVEAPITHTIKEEPKVIR